MALSKPGFPTMTATSISERGNSFQGLKLKAKTLADFRNLQNLLLTQGYAFHSYSLKQEQEIRVVLRSVPKDIAIEEDKEDLRFQNLPVQSVRPLLNRSCYPLDLVLVFCTAEANDKATKAALYLHVEIGLRGSKHPSTQILKVMAL
ncbi:hypothetical protein EVAR_56636_1 [Eumeta japonica]|uniref:Pre-C2HC domain-containing protein n=1 Tax=Eumeta variegata TaxID=151549 RepID=A0A4C1XM20_EUMVA|nr:hypothetical protein EVAR_56636_1 [Eumeta japonica]